MEIEVNKNFYSYFPDHQLSRSEKAGRVIIIVSALVAVGALGGVGALYFTASSFQPLSSVALVGLSASSASASLLAYGHCKASRPFVLPAPTYENVVVSESEEDEQEEEIEAKKKPPLIDLHDYVDSKTWELCGKGYKAGAIERYLEALNGDHSGEKKWAFLFLAPFFLRLYVASGNERPVILERIQKTLLDHHLSTLFEEFPRFQEKRPFFTTALFSLIAPFNTFYEEAYPGKKFLYHLIHEFAFRSSPFSEGNRNESNFEKALYTITLPFLSQMTEEPQKEIAPYLRALGLTKAGKSSEKFATLSLEPTREELKEFKPTFDSFVERFCSNLDAVFADYLNPFLLSQKGGRQMVWITNDLRKMAGALKNEIVTILGPSVSSPGEFLQKSFFLAEAFNGLYRKPNFRQTLLRGLTSLFTDPLKKAGIESNSSFEKLIGSFFEGMNEGEEYWDTLKRSPIHDLLLLPLLLVWGTQHVGKLRPWLSDHKGGALSLVKLFNFQELEGMETAAAVGLDFYLKLMAPINGALFGNYPGKNGMIRSALWLAYKNLPKDLDWASDCRPIITFLLLGTFGNKGKEREALETFNNRLLTFYRKLYSFKPEPSPNIEAHIQSCLKTLFTPK